MTDYDNSNRIALWLNDKRETQKHPHLKGHGKTTVDVWASAWFTKDLNPEDARLLKGIITRHNSNSKSPFLAISLKPKEESQASNASSDRPASAGAHADFDDDIPF